MRACRPDESWIMDNYGSYEVNIGVILNKKVDKTRFSETQGEKGNFICPKCKANCSFNPAFQKYKVCVECDWDERVDKKPTNKKQFTPLQEEEERKKKLPLMVGKIISPMPAILFTEAQLKSYGKSLDDDRGCWGWADPEIYALRMTPNTYKLHRRQFANTVAHETAHLSPKQLISLKDFEDETKDLKGWIEKRSLATRLQSNYKFETKAEAIEYLRTHDFSDGKIPVIFAKKAFMSDPFGAGDGHGHEWFLEFQSYKGILYSSYQNWIDDPRQPPLEKFKYPTYSAGWMRKNTRYEDKKEFVKSWQNADLFGSEIFADEDEDLAKQYYGW